MKVLFIAVAVIAALLLPIAGAASTVTLTGGCPLYVINSTRSYITFNITNAGNGTASDLLVSASFPGIDSNNATQVIQTVSPGGSYSRQFYLSHLIGQGSYAVNINATYVQSGSNYATVFPCIIYIGSLAGGPLLESVSVIENQLNVTIINTAPASIQAQVTAVVPPSFSVKNSTTKAISVPADGKAKASFNVVTPSYTSASFPVIGELSYEYGSSHYAQMASSAIVFGSGGSSVPAQGNGEFILWVLAIIIVIILALIVVSLLMRTRSKKSEE